MPIFLTIEEVIEIHADQINLYGGDPALRDRGLLQSAIAMAASGFGGEYLHAFPAGMAAAYHFHLVSNHAFIDGNKRVGAAAARVFLLTNDVAFDPPEAEYETLTLAVASGQATKDQVIAFFERYAVAP